MATVLLQNTKRFRVDDAITLQTQQQQGGGVRSKVTNGAKGTSALLALCFIKLSHSTARKIKTQCLYTHS